MDNNVFKSAEPTISDTTPVVPEASAPPDSITEAPSPLRINSNPSLDEARANGEPYANQVLNSDTPFNFLPSRAQSDLKAIDKYVEEEISDRGWQHNISAYKKVMQELEFDMGLSDESISGKIERLAAYAKSMSKIHGIDSVKGKLVRKLKAMKDPRDMEKAIIKEIGSLIV